jgi:hypothetical protein
MPGASLRPFHRQQPYGAGFSLHRVWPRYEPRVHQALREIGQQHDQRPDTGAWQIALDALKADPECKVTVALPEIEIAEPPPQTIGSDRRSRHRACIRSPRPHRTTATRISRRPEMPVCNLLNHVCEAVPSCGLIWWTRGWHNLDAGAPSASHGWPAWKAASRSTTTW